MELLGGTSCIKLEAGVFQRLMIGDNEIPSDAISQSGISTLSNKSLLSESTRIVDAKDATKSLIFDTAASESGATTKFSVSSAVPRVYNFVDPGEDCDVLLSRGEQNIISNGTALQVQSLDSDKPALVALGVHGSMRVEPDKCALAFSDAAANNARIEMKDGHLLYTYNDKSYILSEGAKGASSDSDGLLRADQCRLLDGATEHPVAEQLAKRDSLGNLTAKLFIGDLAGASESFAGELQGAVTGSMTATKISEGAVGSAELKRESIYDSHISPGANITDDKLAPITSAGKVADSATSACSEMKTYTIVRRDEHGDFEANNIKADLTGTVFGDVMGSATTVTGLFSGDVGGTQDKLLLRPAAIVDLHISPDAAIDDSKLATLKTPGKVDNSATTATPDNKPGAIVMRDDDGHFEFGTARGNITGMAGGFTGSLVGDVRGTQDATYIMDGAIKSSHLSMEVRDRIENLDKIDSKITSATEKNVDDTIVLRRASGVELPRANVDGLLISGDRLVPSGDFVLGQEDGTASIKVTKDTVQVAGNFIIPRAATIITEAAVTKYLPLSRQSFADTVLEEGQSARVCDSISVNASDNFKMPLFYINNSAAGTMIALQGTLMIGLTSEMSASVIKSNWSAILNPALGIAGSYVHVDSSTPVSSFGQGQSFNITPLLSWREDAKKRLYIEVSFGGGLVGTMTITHLTDILLSLNLSTPESAVIISSR